MRIEVKRAYEKAAKADGHRVLVDRLWPRGVSKQSAKIDSWAKEAAPSAALRTWFHADKEARFREFSKKYEAELKGSAALREARKELKGKARVTLVTAAKDVEHSHVPTLMRFLKR
jgi:uncharacterized protein YeaO (DUF488 family)